jgi:serine protease Do
MITKISSRLAAICLLVNAVISHVGAQSVDFRDAIKKITPATVAVLLTSDTNQPQNIPPNDLAPMFGGVDTLFLTTQAASNQRSGFAVSNTMIISCDIPSNQLDVQVKMADGKTQAGVVVARDHVTGLAAIVIESTNVAGIGIAEGTAESGLPVLVGWLDGNSAIFSSSMIASGPTATGSQRGMEQRLDEEFLPQKVGAPVVDAVGNLVGIFVGSPGRTSCVPATVLSRLIQVASGEKPSDLFRGRLGIQLGEEDTSIMSIMDGTPAAKAELEPGDKVTKIGDIPCYTPADVVGAVGMWRAGDTVTLEVQRGDETLTRSIELASAGPESEHQIGQATGPIAPFQRLFQYKDGQLMPLNPNDPNDPRSRLFRAPIAPAAPAPPAVVPDQRWIQGNLQVERSKLEESLRQLEQQKQEQDAVLKDLRETLEEIKQQLRSEAKE